MSKFYKKYEDLYVLETEDFSLTGKISFNLDHLDEFFKTIDISEISNLNSRIFHNGKYTYIPNFNDHFSFAYNNDCTIILGNVLVYDSEKLIEEPLINFNILEARENLILDDFELSTLIETHDLVFCINEQLDL